MERTLQEREDFSRGFDRGNYGNAYESQDWETWWAENSVGIAGKVPTSDAFQSGALVGFFSSYELDEVSDEAQRDALAVARAEWGEE